jgi:AraC family transcriptional regulator
MPTLTIVGDDGGRVLDETRGRLHDRAEMGAADTHGTPERSANRLLLDSTGLGWHDAYTSLTSESRWSDTLPALPHLSVAYCHRRSARIRRHVDGGGVELADLLPRRFGMIPADRASTWEVDGNPEVQLVYLRRETIDELATNEFDVDPRQVHIEPRLGFSDPLLEPLVASLLEAARLGGRLSTSALWADHVVRVLGLELLRRHSNISGRPSAASDATPSRLAAIRDYVEANLASDLSLAGIAGAVGLRPHRLARDFRDGIGVPLHQYVIDRRVERAAALLRRSDLPIAAIAIDCGFADQSHLTNAFRRRVGVTPAAYRAGT